MRMVFGQKGRGPGGSLPNPPCSFCGICLRFEIVFLNFLFFSSFFFSFLPPVTKHLQTPPGHTYYVVWNCSGCSCTPPPLVEKSPSLVIIVHISLIIYLRSNYFIVSQSPWLNIHACPPREPVRGRSEAGAISFVVYIP